MTEDSRLTTLRRLAWACLLLMLAVTCASAWLRLAQPRPACVDWPGCRSADRPAKTALAPALLGAPQVLARVRAAHRGAATAVLLVVLAMVVLTRTCTPSGPAARRLALALLLLALGLSALGIVTPGSRAVGVLLGNLLGGLLMLALSWRLVVHLHDMPGSSPALARWALLGAALWAAQAALGALSGSGQLEPASVAHIAVALLAGPCAVGVGWVVLRPVRPQVRRRGRRAQGLALLGLSGLQFVLGASAAGTAAAPALVLLHNVGAALGLALLVGLARRDRMAG